MPDWYITDSAVERYHYAMRWRVHDSARARVELSALAQMATFRARDRKGRELWRSSKRLGRGLRWARVGAHPHDLGARTDDRRRGRRSLMENRIVESVRRLRGYPGIIFQREFVRCGKSRCKCTVGILHGPYWYSYHWNKRRRVYVSKYVGRELPRPRRAA